MQKALLKQLRYAQADVAHCEDVLTYDDVDCQVYVGPVMIEGPVARTIAELAKNTAEKRVKDLEQQLASLSEMAS